MSNICVFLGATEGKNPVYRATAHLLGLEMLNKTAPGYGGARSFNGCTRRCSIRAGGDAIGVMPTSLPNELQHNQLTKLHIVDTCLTEKH